MRGTQWVAFACVAVTLTGCEQARHASPALDAMSGADTTSDARHSAGSSGARSADIVLPAASAIAATPATSSDDRTPAPISLPRGTVIAVHLDRSLSTTHSRAGQAFHAVLTAPLIVDGRTVLPRGARFTGHVTTSESSGRLKGRAELGITLDGVDVEGRRYPISTSVTTRRGAAHTRRNVTFIGGGSGLGALVGGWTGGKKGVAIGTAVGAGAGTAAAATTGKQDLEMPAKQVYRFSLAQAVRIPG